MRIEGITLTVFDSYELVESREQERMVVSTLPLSVARGESKTYDPTADPALFLRFLEIEEDQDDAVLEAVREFGLVGKAVTLEDLYFVDSSTKTKGGLPVVARLGTPGTVPTPGESLKGPLAGDRLSDWRTEVRDLKAVWIVWMALKELDLDILSQWIVWEHPDRPELATVRMYDGPCNGWAFSSIPGDFIGPAAQFVREKIELRLHRWTRAKLLSTGKSIRLEIGLSPDNLLGVVWLQMAEAIEKRMTAKRCKECGMWFELRPKMREKEFCSNACRMRAYRRGKKDSEGAPA